MIATEEDLLVPGSWERPKPVVLEGRFCRVEPLALNHSDHLFKLFNVPDAVERYKFISTILPNKPDRETHDKWLAEHVAREDLASFVVIDKATNTVEGKENLTRIEAEFGAVELGGLLYGPAIARSRVATEAFFLIARYVFDDLKYRRFVWRSNNNNEASKKAAVRFGFTYEGLFRQHGIFKGQNRDSVWYSILDKEWPALKQSFEKWLDESNFNDDGTQKKPLQSFREFI